MARERRTTRDGIRIDDGQNRENPCRTDSSDRPAVMQYPQVQYLSRKADRKGGVTVGSAVQVRRVDAAVFSAVSIDGSYLLRAGGLGAIVRSGVPALLHESARCFERCCDTSK